MRPRGYHSAQIQTWRERRSIRYRLDPDICGRGDRDCPRGADSSNACRTLSRWRPTERSPAGRRYMMPLRQWTKRQMRTCLLRHQLRAPSHFLGVFDDKAESTTRIKSFGQMLHAAVTQDSRSQIDDRDPEELGRSTRNPRAVPTDKRPRVDVVGPIFVVWGRSHDPGLSMPFGAKVDECRLSFRFVPLAPL